MTTSYVEKVRRTASSALIGYWPFNENDGTTAWDWGKAGGRNGTSSGIVPADKFLYGLDGGPVYKFDGSASYVNVAVTALLAAFSGAEGTFSIWAYMLNWADSAEGKLFQAEDAAIDDYVYLNKYTDNKVYLAREANGGGGVGWHERGRTRKRMEGYSRRVERDRRLHATLYRWFFGRHAGQFHRHVCLCSHVYGHWRR